MTKTHEEWKRDQQLWVDERITHLYTLFDSRGISHFTDEELMGVKADYMDWYWKIMGKGPIP